jgi:hypothetical protein
MHLEMNTIARHECEVGIVKAVSFRNTVMVILLRRGRADRRSGMNDRRVRKVFGHGVDKYNSKG